MTDTTSPRNQSESPASSPSAAETPRIAPRSDAQPVPAPEVTPDAERASAGRVALIRAALDSAPDALITLDADDVREMWLDLMLSARLDAVLKLHQPIDHGRPRRHHPVATPRRRLRRSHPVGRHPLPNQCHAVAAGPLAGASTLQQPATVRVLDATSTPPF